MIKQVLAWLHKDCHKKFETFRKEQQARYTILEGANTHIGKLWADTKKELDDLKAKCRNEEYSKKNSQNLRHETQEQRQKDHRAGDKMALIEALKKEKNNGTQRRAKNRS